jgi:predicted permease
VNEQVFTIIGIAPEHFSGTMMLIGPELYFPLGMHDVLGGDILKGSAKHSLAERGDHQLFLVARLKPGVTMATATPVLQGLAANLEKGFPAEQKDQTFIMAPLPRLSTSTAPARDRGLTVLGSLLIGMAAIVLLIACLNLANLLLARGHARRKEIAIRLALGGGRRRLVRQLLTEGALLALLGGAGGFACALWGTGLLINSISTRFPLALFFHGAANPALFAAALGFCGLATLGFALGPALQLTRDASIDDLKQQAGEDAGAARRRWRWLPRHPMLTAQIALSLGLLITAGLFVRGAVKAGNVDTGFKTDRTFLVEVDASLSGYDEPRALQAYAQINERLARLPGVEASAIGSVVPFGMISMERDVRRAGVHVEPGAHPATAAEGRAFVGRWSSVGADYFQTLGLPLLRGRVFVATECGQTGAPKVAIIDEGLARRLFPDGDALGQRITFANPGDAADKSAAEGLEVVGIVPATRWGLFDAKDMGSIYVPFAQGYMSNVFFHVRAATSIVGHESAWLDTLRREVRTAAPNVGVFSVVTFGQHLERSLELWIVRIGATLFGLFGALALLLATVGIYGVKSYGITRRTREIGIRVALGAEPGRVRRMILREGLATTLLGLAIGVLLGLALGQACAGLLYDVSPRDPTALMVAPTVLLLATLVASWIPARRATQVSPLVALRTE